MLTIKGIDSAVTSSIIAIASKSQITMTKPAHKKHDITNTIWSLLEPHLPVATLLMD